MTADDLLHDAKLSEHITGQPWRPEQRVDGVYLVGIRDGSMVLKLCRSDHGSDLLMAVYIAGLQEEAQRRRNKELQEEAQCRRKQGEAKRRRKKLVLTVDTITDDQLRALRERRSPPPPLNRRDLRNLCDCALRGRGAYDRAARQRCAEILNTLEE